MSLLKLAIDTKSIQLTANIPLLGIIVIQWISYIKTAS
jgi:hypothetical protein